MKIPPLAAVVLSAPVFLAGMPATAHARCNYNQSYTTNCTDAARDWFYGAGSSHQTGSQVDAARRATSGMGVVRECIDCALDHFTSGTSSATSTSTSTSTDDD